MINFNKDIIKSKMNDIKEAVREGLVLLDLKLRIESEDYCMSLKLRIEIKDYNNKLKGSEL